MIIIRPVEVVDATLTSTNQPEDDAPEWLVGTSYSIEDEVMVTSGDHSVYVSLTDNNQGNVPTSDDIRTPVFWARISATNRWAMFSDQISDQTLASTGILNVTVTPGVLVDSMALFNLSGQAVQIAMTDPVDGLVYFSTVQLYDTSVVTDWYSYYFEGIQQRKEAVFTDLPPYPNADIQIVVSQPGTGSDTRCGLVTFGPKFTIGVAEFGTAVTIVDHSTKDTDAFGNTVVVPRKFSKKATYNVYMNTESVGLVQNVLSGLRTVPMTWIGDEDRSSTIVFGYYNDFDIILSNPITSQATIEVEGLT